VIAAARGQFLTEPAGKGRSQPRSAIRRS
jgi:hypothetical protein